MTTTTETVYARAITELATAAGMTRRDVALRVAQMLREYESSRPVNPAHQRTARIAGAPYHWAEFDGRLLLVKGESPWGAS